jgi:hypothetical protein
MRLKPLVAASAIIAVGVVVVGIAYAAIPGAGGQIQGCYVTKGGALRVVNAASECTKQELPLAWNQAGQPGTNGAPGVSPTVLQLTAGDANCPAGGAKITDAAGTAAYVCSGQNGQDGQPFSGTFTSPNGSYAISVTDTGITLKRNSGGPTITLVGNDITVKSSGTAKVEAGTNLTLKGASDVEVHGTTATLKGDATATVEAGGAATVHGVQTEIKGDGFTKVNGGLVFLNGGGTPVARVGDIVVDGVIAPPGSPTVLVP